MIEKVLQFFPRVLHIFSIERLCIKDETSLGNERKNGATTFSQHGVFPTCPFSMMGKDKSIFVQLGFSPKSGMGDRSPAVP
jgi:hypothetical protein